jgi:hypothetical protein
VTPEGPRHHGRLLQGRDGSGRRDDSAPGIRRIINHPNYQGAFVLDPMITEAVCYAPPE